MDLKIGTRELKDVGIPVLWGHRAVAQDSQGHLSVIDFKSHPARLEILADQPAPGVNFVPTMGGFRILSFRDGVYDYNKKDRTLTSPTSELPECQIDDSYVRVGPQVFPKNADYRTDASLHVTAKDVHLVTRLPQGLAELVTSNIPNPEILEHSFILTGTTITGEIVKIARGICECNEDRDLSKEYFLSVDERWSCPDCGLIYSFNGERINVKRPVSGVLPPDG